MNSQNYEEHAYQNMHGRHMNRARHLAKSITADAGRILARLDNDAIPQCGTLPEDIIELARRIASLEEIQDLHDVYNSSGVPGGETR